MNSARGWPLVFLTTLFVIACLSTPTAAAAVEQRIALVPGYNLIGLTVATTAETSFALLRRCPIVSGVYRFDPRASYYESALRVGGTDLDGRDFPLEPGWGYLVRAAAAGTLTIQGAPIERPVYRLLIQGFAYVGITGPGLTSTLLLDTQPAVKGVYRFDPVAKRYEGHLRLGPEEYDGRAFDLEPGGGYIVRTTAEALLILPPSSLGRGTLDLAAYCDELARDLTSQLVWDLLSFPVEGKPFRVRLSDWLGIPVERKDLPPLAR